MVAAGFWTSLVRRVVSRQTQVRVGQDSPQDAASTGADEEPGGYRLAGEPQPLDRLATVRPDTLALVLTEGDPPRVQLPGDHLMPSLRPGHAPTQVMVVNTAPVALDVTIDELQTLDGSSLQATTVRITVQLVAEEYHRLLVDLTAEFETDLEARLLGRVQQEVVASARAAVRMNRLADIRRLTLTHLLADRWLPQTLAGGAFVRRHLSVVEVGWPDAPGSATATPLEPEVAPEPPAEPFTLRLDPDLARLWREHAAAELRGISGAQVLTDTSVIAVASSEPGAYESSRLHEAFGRYFHDRHVHLILAPADSYDELVENWFKQVDGSPGRLESVESVAAGAEQVLRITVDQSLASTRESEQGVSAGSAADRKALRRLVPHERIEFLPSDTR